VNNSDTFITINNENPKSNQLNLFKPIAISVIFIAILAITGIVILALNPKGQTSTAEQSEEDKHAALVKYIGTTEMQELYKKLLGKEVVISFIPSDYLDNNDKYVIETTVDKTGTITNSDTTEYISFSITNDEIDTPDTAVDFVLHEKIEGVDTYVMQTGENTYQFFNGSVTTEYDKLEDAILDHQLLRAN